MYGSSTSVEHRARGTRIPATSGSKRDSSSCSPAKYHGAFAGSGREVGVREAAEWRGERDAQREHRRATPEPDDDVAHERGAAR